MAGQGTAQPSPNGGTAVGLPSPNGETVTVDRHPTVVTGNGTVKMTGYLANRTVIERRCGCLGVRQRA